MNNKFLLVVVAILFFVLFSILIRGQVIDFNLLERHVFGGHVVIEGRPLVVVSVEEEVVKISNLNSDYVLDLNQVGGEELEIIKGYADFINGFEDADDAALLVEELDDFINNIKRKQDAEARELLVKVIIGIVVIVILVVGVMVMVIRYCLKEDKKYHDFKSG